MGSRRVPCAVASFPAHGRAAPHFFAKSPSGFSYVNKNSTLFTNPTILVTEFSDYGTISAYGLYEDGTPDLSTKKVIVKDVNTPIGGMSDPLTGDYLFTFYNGCTDRRSIYLISNGFNAEVKAPPYSFRGKKGFFMGGTSSAATNIDSQSVEKISYITDVISSGLYKLVNPFPTDIKGYEF